MWWGHTFASEYFFRKIKSSKVRLSIQHSKMLLHPFQICWEVQTEIRNYCILQMFRQPNITFTLHLGGFPRKVFGKRIAYGVGFDRIQVKVEICWKGLEYEVAPSGRESRLSKTVNPLRSNHGVLGVWFPFWFCHLCSIRILIRSSSTKGFVLDIG